jgi:hypothetical protein
MISTFVYIYFLPKPLYSLMQMHSLSNTVLLKIFLAEGIRTQGEESVVPLM